MAKRYVPDGACLVCNKGLGFGKLKVTNHKNVSLYGEKSATEGDKVTGLNIPSLGICSVTRAACQPVPTKWSGVQEGITIGPYRKLLEDSKLGCGIGGQISVYFSIPSAMLAVKNNMKENADLQAKKLGAKVDDWFKKQFDDAEKRNNVLPDGKARKFGLGVVEGVYGGVKGIGEGLLFLKKMQDKVMDTGLHAITHPVETAGQIKDAAVATKDATVKAAEWVSNTDNLKNTAASIGEAHVKAYNWVTTSGNVQKAATSAYNGSVEKLKEARDWAGKQSPRDWGNYTGRGVFEVGLMATGVGEAKAVVEGANVAGKLGEGANVVSKTAEAANVGEKAAEGANVVDKAVEGKRLGEVVSETVPAKTVNVIDEVILKAPETKFGKQRLAYEHYKQLGWPKERIRSHMDGIDFEKPVELVELKEGKITSQFQMPGGKTGNYFAYPDAKATELGINPMAEMPDGSIVPKEKLFYQINKDVKVLKSTAKTGIKDFWSVQSQPPFMTSGEGTQFFTTDNSSFIPKIK